MKFHMLILKFDFSIMTNYVPIMQPAKNMDRTIPTLNLSSHINPNSDIVDLAVPSVHSHEPASEEQRLVVPAWIVG